MKNCMKGLITNKSQLKTQRVLFQEHNDKNNHEKDKFNKPGCFVKQ